MNWNGFPSIFQKVQYFHSRHYKTTSHLLRISLNGILKLNEVWPLEGALYISLWENSRGHPDNVSFMQFSTKIDGFEQRDSQGFENSYNSYEQYPLEKFLIFTIYQNYTLAELPTVTKKSYLLRNLEGNTKIRKCIQKVRFWRHTEPNVTAIHFRP